MEKQLYWKAIGKSVQGADHIRNNKPCQDCVLWKAVEDSIIFAIADGHGSKRSPYSDEGAQIAVNVAAEILEQMYKDYNNSNKNLSNIKQFSEEHLKKLLVRRWREKVETAYEKRKVMEDISKPNEDFYIKYGSTVIAVIATPEFILCLQLGDGDIVIILENGGVCYPIEKDKNIVGVETASLCSQYAWKEVKTMLYRLNSIHNDIEMLMLTTDGYYNSFVNDEGFEKTAVEYLQLIKENGIEKVGENLETWLSDISSEGCGDDITLGILCLENLSSVCEQKIN